MAALSLHSVGMCHPISNEASTHSSEAIIESSDVGFSGLHLINRRRPL